MGASERRQTVPTVHSSSRNEEALEHDPKGARHRPILHPQVFGRNEASFGLAARTHWEVSIFGTAFAIPQQNGNRPSGIRYRQVELAVSVQVRDYKIRIIR